jgi:transposase
MIEARKLNFKQKTIYIGIDDHKKDWLISIVVDDIEHTRQRMPASPRILSNYVKRMFPGARYLSVYEAGYSGYWIHEELKRYGIENIIVNPADVPTTDKERRGKTDKRDCRKLARGLINGELKGICIRDSQQLADRNLIRTRDLLVKKQTRCKNQIKSLLSFGGIRITEEVEDRHWSKRYIEWIEQRIKEKPEVTYSMEILLEELKFLRDSIAKITKKIREISQSERYKEKVRLLRTIPGISILTSMIILTELGSLRIYKKLDNICSYVGLCSDEHSSGDRERKTGITKRGNKILKKSIIESSWVAVRKDPALLLAFKNYIKGTKKTKAIVKIARKLLNRIRYVLVNEKEYNLLTV